MTDDELGVLLREADPLHGRELLRLAVTPEQLRERADRRRSWWARWRR